MCGPTEHDLIEQLNLPMEQLEACVPEGPRSGRAAHGLDSATKSSRSWTRRSPPSPNHRDAGAGAPADFIMLLVNPLEDVANLREILWVWIG